MHLNSIFKVIFLFLFNIASSWVLCQSILLSTDTLAHFPLNKIVETEGKLISYRIEPNLNNNFPVEHRLVQVNSSNQEISELFSIHSTEVFDYQFIFTGSNFALIGLGNKRSSNVKYLDILLLNKKFELIDHINYDILRNVISSKCRVEAIDSSLINIIIQGTYFNDNQTKLFEVSGNAAIQHESIQDLNLDTFSRISGRIYLNDHLIDFQSIGVLKLSYNRVDTLFYKSYDFIGSYSVNREIVVIDSNRYLCYGIGQGIFENSDENQPVLVLYNEADSSLTQYIGSITNMGSTALIDAVEVVDNFAYILSNTNSKLGSKFSDSTSFYIEKIHLSDMTFCNKIRFKFKDYFVSPFSISVVKNTIYVTGRKGDVFNPEEKFLVLSFPLDLLKNCISGTHHPVVHPNTLSFYPNPVVDVIYLDEQQSYDRIFIYDMQGRLVQQYNDVEQELHAGNLPAGKYQLIAQKDTQYYTADMMKL